MLKFILFVSAGVLFEGDFCLWVSLIPNLDVSEKIGKIVIK